MHYLNEDHILLFLLQLFVLLTMARLLGQMFTRWGHPAIVGEILTGVLLGPTILGRIFPSLQSMLFPNELIQQNMLETVSWIGVLFLLLATGFEVNVSSVWRQGKTALQIGVIGVFTPFLLSVAIFWWLPSSYWGSGANHLTFTLFLATAASISAISVIAKILHDIEILKTDFGLTILSAFVVNDFLGWIIFAFVMSLAGQAVLSLGQATFTFFGVTVFGVLCLILGSRFVSWCCKKMEFYSLHYSGGVFVLITCLAMLTGVITQLLGLHAILGFLLAGIMAGNSREIPTHTKEIMSQMIHSVFVPIFFASIAVKIDFLQHLDFFMITLFTLTAIGGKFFGAGLGAYLAKLDKPDILSVAIAHIPGGAMEIILGVLALELHLIPENVFVAIVIAALFSSIIVGPLLAKSVRRRQPIDVSDYLLKKSFILNLECKTQECVFEEMVSRLTEQIALDKASVISALQTQEKLMSSSLENGLAIPHAHVKNIEKPVICFGISHFGLEWDTPDARPTHFVFLVLTPAHSHNEQMQIITDITDCLSEPQTQDKVMALNNLDDIYDFLKTELQQKRIIWELAPR
jgi:Kef-type K+ transport system membrane component KefB/mannitol/fructose-specific phosphotransferase system IIA component (Ntr-type)